MSTAMENKQDLTTLTDKELLYLIRQNDGQALLMLFDRYAAALYNHVLSQVRARTLKDQEPEDVTQNILTDIFTSLWDNQNTLSIATTVRAYLFADAYNRAVDYLRHRKSYTLSPYQGGPR